MKAGYGHAGVSSRLTLLYFPVIALQVIKKLWCYSGANAVLT